MLLQTVRLFPRKLLLTVLPVVMMQINQRSILTLMRAHPGPLSLGSPRLTLSGGWGSDHDQRLPWIWRPRKILTEHHLGPLIGL